MWAAIVAVIGVVSILVQRYFSDKAAKRVAQEHAAELEKARRDAQDGKTAAVPQLAPGVSQGQSNGWDAADKDAQGKP